MNETKIKVNGKNVPVRFGSYVISLLAEDGITLVDFGNGSTKRPNRRNCKGNLLRGGQCLGGKARCRYYARAIFLIGLMRKDGGFTSDEVTRLFELFGKYLDFGVTKKAESEGQTMNQTTK